MKWEFCHAYDKLFQCNKFNNINVFSKVIDKQDVVQESNCLFYLYISWLKLNSAHISIVQWLQV